MDNETKSNTDWSSDQAQRAAALTAEAARLIGLSPSAADEVGRGAGIALQGLVATVSVLPVLKSADVLTAPLIVTLKTARRLADVPTDALVVMLALAPTLSHFQASIGCDPDGSLCLFRLVNPEDVSAQGIADALRHAWHLAELVWGADSAPRGAQ